MSKLNLLKKSQKIIIWTDILQCCQSIDGHFDYFDTFFQISGQAEDQEGAARSTSFEFPDPNTLLDQLSDADPNSLDECCICLERKPDVILPCTHSYCMACIEQWNVDHKTCPVCRETLASTDDGWVISDGPDSLDVAIEIQKSLMDLAHE